MIPRETVCINLVGLYTVTNRLGNDRSLLTMTFVYPATDWFEIALILDKSGKQMSHIFNSTWLTRYPHPQKVIFDNGNKFKKDFLPLLHGLGTKPTFIIVKNQQDNIILE